MPVTLEIISVRPTVTMSRIFLCSLLSTAALFWDLRRSYVMNNTHFTREKKNSWEEKVEARR